MNYSSNDIFCHDMAINIRHLYVCVLLLLQQCIDNLNIQIDTFESEIETLMARKRKDRDVSGYLSVLYLFKSRRPVSIELRLSI